MSEGGLQRKVFSGLIWKFGERIGAQAVSFLVSIILARLLLPSDYGVIALITIFIDIANVFVSSGFGAALVQKKDADEVDFSSVFYFSIVMSWVLYIIVFLGAPAVAGFYDKEILTPVLRVMALKLPLAGVNSVQHAYVQKKMLFKRFFFSTLIGTVGSAVVGIVMAYTGFGAWALVAQYLFNSTMDTVVLWFTVRWRPVWRFSLGRMKYLFGFGWKMLASELIHTSYKQIRSLIIGKVYTEKDLAFYNQGGKLPSLIVTNINSSVSSVLFPAMTLKQDDTGKLKEMVRLSIRVSSYIMWPLMIGLLVISEPIVRLMFTEKWLPCVPYMQIACIQFALEPVQTANVQAVKAMGKGRTYLIMEIVKKLFGIVMIVAVMYQGVMAIAVTAMFVTFFAALVNSTPNRKYLGYTYREQLVDLIPSILLAAAMGICVYGVGRLPVPDLVSIVLQAVSGAASYIIISLAFRVSQFRYIVDILKNFIKVIRNRR
ncbi:MAG: lipopolysaccharide biosynthesis protein [Eubacterium sp.]|nr:lipopolysaccharide biosynthesis protein [Eubacterium sp.]